MPSVAETVTAIIARQALLRPDQVAPDASPGDLGLDSIGMVEAVFAIEEAFDITVPFSPNDPAQAPGFDTETVAGLIAGVEALVAQKGK